MFVIALSLINQIPLALFPAVGALPWLMLLTWLAGRWQPSPACAAALSRLARPALAFGLLGKPAGHGSVVSGGPCRPSPVRGRQQEGIIPGLWIACIACWLAVAFRPGRPRRVLVSWLALLGLAGAWLLAEGPMMWATWRGFQP